MVLVEILWGHWILLGLVLMVAELAIPSFTIFWFGLGAYVVAGVLALWPAMPPAVQMVVWAVASICWTVIWFRWVRPRMSDRTKAGTGKDAILGEVGIIVRPVTPCFGKGMVRFPVPILGAEEWFCHSAEVLIPGEEVVVKDIDGHVLRVARRMPAQQTLKGGM